jgi:hypothetical protein
MHVKIFFINVLNLFYFFYKNKINLFHIFESIHKHSKVCFLSRSYSIYVSKFNQNIYLTFNIKYDDKNNF